MNAVQIARATGVLAGLLSIVGCTQQVAIPPLAPAAPLSPAATPIAAGEGPRAVELRRITLAIDGQTQIGTMSVGLGCWSTDEMYVDFKPKTFLRGPRYSGRFALRTNDLAEAFARELAAAHYPMLGATDVMFKDPETKAEVLVAAIITGYQGNLCAPQAGFGNFVDTKARSS